MSHRFKYCVLRLPCLMEDEGRAHFVEFFPSVEAARKWIAAQEGYFTPSNYEVYAEVEPLS